MEAFASYDAVLIHSEAKNKKADGLRYCFATFAVAGPEGILGERVYREGAEADALERLKVGDCVQLNFETEAKGIRQSTKCIGFTPKVGKKAVLTVK